MKGEFCLRVVMLLNGKKIKISFFEYFKFMFLLFFKKLLLERGKSLKKNNTIPNAPERLTEVGIRLLIKYENQMQRNFSKRPRSITESKRRILETLYFLHHFYLNTEEGTRF